MRTTYRLGLQTKVGSIADAGLVEDLQEVDPAERRQNVFVNLAGDQTALRTYKRPRPMLQNRGLRRTHLLVCHLDTLAGEQFCRRILPVLVNMRLAEVLFRYVAMLDLLLQSLGVCVSYRVLRVSSAGSGPRHHPRAHLVDFCGHGGGENG
jgi:hypothetical protein